MSELERFTLLRVTDEKWIEHLSNIELLREGIHLRGYGQKDPQVEFIREAAEEFDGLKRRLRDDTLHYLFRVEVQVPEQIEEHIEQKETMHATSTNRDNETPAEPIKRTGAKLGRNDPCWCGSGKKWKKCHYPEER